MQILCRYYADTMQILSDAIGGGAGVPPPAKIPELDSRTGAGGAKSQPFTMCTTFLAKSAEFVTKGLCRKNYGLDRILNSPPL